MSIGKNWLCVLVAIFVLFAVPTGVYGEDPNKAEDETLAPYFLIEGGDASTDLFPLKDTKVSANINGTIADIYVVQTYANIGKSPINAKYIFPASARATVHGLKMEIGNKVVTAKIKEREEAKQEFEQAKTEGKSASLLEEQRPNVFSMDIANIMPGDTVHIELHYTELILSTEGVYQFVFPTVVGPRYSNQSAADVPETDKWVETPYLKDGKAPSGGYDITVNLSAGVPVADISCKSHKVDIAREGDKQAKISLADAGEYAGNRDYILDYKLTGQEVQSGLMLYKGDKENFFLLMVQPPEHIKLENVPPREYTFVLDVSGSMNGFPLDTAKELIRNLVSHLRTTDKFNLILYSDTNEALSPESLLANKENIQKAVDLIDRQEGGGGTELSPALEKALSVSGGGDYSRSVIIITDGYIDTEKAIFDLVGKNLNSTSFFSFGIGSSVNRYLIEGIAKAGQGEPFVVTEPDEAVPVADRFKEYIQSPVLSDISVGYEGFDVYDVEPPSIPCLYAQRPVILFGKWRGNPQGTIHISGKTASGNFAQDIQVAGTAPLETNSVLSYLWAREKVARLSDYGLDSGNPDIKSEITQLGLNYSMLTPYTSFVAIIDEIRNKDGNSTDVKQPLPLPLGVSNLAVGGLQEGSEPGILVLGAGIAAILALTVLMRRRKRIE